MINQTWNVTIKANTLGDDIQRIRDHFAPLGEIEIDPETGEITLCPNETTKRAILEAYETGERVEVKAEDMS